MQPDQSHRRRRVNARRQAMPLPLMILVIGVAGSLSIWKYLRDSKLESVVSDFKRDAWTIANQIANRVKRDVDESYTASFMGLAGGDGFTLESWRGFTEEYLVQNADGGIAFSPRVQHGNTNEFDLSARRAYPEGKEFHVFSRSRTKEKVFVGEVGVDGDKNESLAGPPQDMYPILYSNPEQASIIGYDMNSVPSAANAISLMMESKSTVVTEATVGQGDDLPSFSVIQPVFAGGNALGGIIGCAIKWLAIQHFVDSSLISNNFAQRYADADMAVFMRVGGGSSQPEDQLLYDRRTYPNKTRDLFLSGSLTPNEVEDRGTATMLLMESLAADKAIVVVSSFKPPANDYTSTVLLSIGCLTSLLVALLVYGRQLLVLSYKDGMERATITSSFKSRFVADMAHEIRTPLNGIIGTAELLEEETLSPTGFELVGTVRACSNILMGIVNDALDYSKTEIGEMRMEARAASLPKTLLEVMQIMQSAYRSPKGEAVGDVILRLEVDKSIEIAPVLADEARIRQVLVNLISNAFKFTDAGFITVTARFDPVLVDSESLNSKITTNVAPGNFPAAFVRSPPRTPYDKNPSTTSTSVKGCKGAISSKAVSRGKMRSNDCVEMRRPLLSKLNERKMKKQRAGTDLSFLKSLEVPPYKTAVFVVEVKDTGVGMTPQQMDGLFKPFSQVHHGSRRGVGGTGLGLAICKSLCESMGGSIGCTSRPGEGSTFRFNVLVGVDAGTYAIQGDWSDHQDLGHAFSPVASRLATYSRRMPSGSLERSALPRVERPRCCAREWNLGCKGGVHRLKPILQTREASCGALREQRADWAKPRGVAVAGGKGARSHLAREADVCGGAGNASAILTENVWLEAVVATSKERRAQELFRSLSPTADAAMVTPNRPRFLVVDDFRMNRLLVWKMVEALDVDAMFAQDGAEAVKACGETRFSLIFMDVMMPVMNGLEASKAIRTGGSKMNQDTPIIAATASPTLEASEEDSEASVNDLLMKPIMRKPLFLMIAKWASERDVAWMSNAWSRHTETIENRPGK